MQQPYKVLTVVLAVALICTIAVLLWQHQPPPSIDRTATAPYRLVRMRVADLPYESSNQSLGVNQWSDRAEAYDAFIYKNGKQTANFYICFDPYGHTCSLYIGTTLPTTVKCSRPEEAMDRYLAGEIKPVQGDSGISAPLGAR